MSNMEKAEKAEKAGEDIFEDGNALSDMSDTEAKSAHTQKSAVSPAVIKRLPRYFRYLRELIRQGKLRISSAELSALMKVTASQIRQDLNCFGGFGQQGYGYNVNYLYTKISEILGVGEGYTAIIVGAGNLGRALVRSTMFEKRGVDIAAMFDIDRNVIGLNCGGVTVYSMEEAEKFCSENKIDIAVLTCTKDSVTEIADRLAKSGVRGFWNFTGVEIDMSKYDVKVENVHLGDSLMTLCYMLGEHENEKNKDQ